MTSSIRVAGPTLAVQTCARRLAALDPDAATRVTETAPGSATLPLEWADGPAGPPLAVDCTWYGGADVDARPGSEPVVQALSGLMAAHGRDDDGPRRLGLEVAGVAAGVLTAHGVLAGLIGRARGVEVDGIETSVLRAAATLMSHRVASDSSGTEWVPVPDGPAPGPPFRSADGHWVEIETLDPSAWRAFWERLGAGACDLDGAWRRFRPRYFRGTCTLPAGLHEACAAHPLAELAHTARLTGVSLSPVRDYDEVLDEPGHTWGHPPVAPLPGGAAPPRRAPADATGPLAGLRVVEATTRLQGPLPTLLLAHLGAHVVRVEPPGGDWFATVPPLLDDVGSFYRTFNRGKEIVELDLSGAAGRRALRELVADADVFVHNWRPGKATEWELDADDLAGVNPGLVYAHASGWGERPEAARMVGTDFLVQAYAGVGAGLRPQGEPPLPSRVLLTDYLGALNTAEALLRGVYERERTGVGQRVEGSLLAGAMSLQAHVLDDLVAAREQGRCRGRPVWGPLDRPVATADGALVVDVASGDDLHRLADACGAAPSNAGRHALERAVIERLAAGAAADWERGLTAVGLAAATVTTDVAAMPGDPRLAPLFEPLAAGAAVPASPWRLV